MGGKVCLRCKGKTLSSKVWWQHSAMFCLITSSKLSRQWFEFSLKEKVMGSHPGYFLKSFLLWKKHIFWCYHFVLYITSIFDSHYFLNFSRLATNTPFTPLLSQPPSPQFSQPQVSNQQSSRFPPDGSVSSSFTLSSGAGSQSTSDFTQSFSGSLPPLAPIRAGKFLKN